jgi:hypothetical protein
MKRHLVAVLSLLFACVLQTLVAVKEAERTRFGACLCFVSLPGVSELLIEWLEYYRLMGIDSFFLYERRASSAAQLNATADIVSWHQSKIVRIEWPLQPTPDKEHEGDKRAAIDNMRARRACS